MLGIQPFQLTKLLNKQDGRYVNIQVIFPLLYFRDRYNIKVLDQYHLMVRSHRLTF